jgi:DNA mismatch endonuclease, patch repair protein
MTYKPRNPAVTAKVMASIRRKDNKAEVALRKVLFRRGFRYRLQVPHLPGTPDFAFTARRVAVFVDGDYWHGRVLREQGETAYLATMKTARRQFWLDKMRRNIERDDRATKLLKEAGWSVIRVWESEVLADLEGVVQRIEEQLRDASGGDTVNQ